MFGQGQFVASDGWCVDQKEAWFIGTEYNAIFHVSLDSQTCDIVCELPIDSIQQARVNPICVKVRDSIVCLPESGNYLYLYNCKNSCLTTVEFKCSYEGAWSIFQYWVYDERVIALSRGKRCIVSIDPDTGAFDMSASIGDESSVLSYGVFADDSVYITDSSSNRIFQYDIKKGYVKEHKLNCNNAKFNSICYDGNSFWLTGNRKEIYAWNAGKGTINVYDEFPNSFGKYDLDRKNIDSMINEYNTFPFSHCLCINDYVCAIPFNTNMILRINRLDGSILGYDDGESVSDFYARYLHQKYLLEYIRCDRYIGLYSLNKKSVFELDVDTMNCQEKNYRIVDTRAAINKGVFLENGLNVAIYDALLREI